MVCTCECCQLVRTAVQKMNSFLKILLVMNIQKCRFLETRDLKVDSRVLNLDSFKFRGSALYIKQTRYRHCQ